MKLILNKFVSPAFMSVERILVFHAGSVVKFFLDLIPGVPMNYPIFTEHHKSCTESILKIHDFAMAKSLTQIPGILCNPSIFWGSSTLHRFWKFVELWY